MAEAVAQFIEAPNISSLLVTLHIKQVFRSAHQQIIEAIQLDDIDITGGNSLTDVLERALQTYRKKWHRLSVFTMFEEKGLDPESDLELLEQDDCPSEVDFLRSK